MARKLIALFKYHDLDKPKFRKELKALIKKIKEEAQYEEDRKYYGIPKVK